MDPYITLDSRPEAATPKADCHVSLSTAAEPPQPHTPQPEPASPGATFPPDTPATGAGPHAHPEAAQPHPSPGPPAPFRKSLVGGRPRTQAQREAARRNGAKSRGPVTPQGKRNSSRNAVRYGIHSNLLTLNGRDRKAFAALLASLRDDLNPSTPLAEALVESIAGARWRVSRVWATEAAVLRDEASKDPSTRNTTLRIQRAFHRLASSSNILHQLDRYEARYENQFHRAIVLLAKANAKRNTNLQNEPEQLTQSK